MTIDGDRGFGASIPKSKICVFGDLIHLSIGLCVYTHLGDFCRCIKSELAHNLTDSSVIHKDKGLLYWLASYLVPESVPGNYGRIPDTEYILYSDTMLTNNLQ